MDSNSFEQICKVNIDNIGEKQQMQQHKNGWSNWSLGPIDPQ